MSGDFTQRRKGAKKTKELWFLVLLCAFAPLREFNPAAAAPPITAAAFTPDGKQVVTGSQAGIEVRSWPALTVTGHLKTDLSHVPPFVLRGTRRSE